MISPGMLLSERYEIIDRVGSGGMADVYKARDQRLNRFVAIKILKPEYSDDAKFVSKFRGEAQSVAGLSHPNIVNVYDVGEDDSLYYIVMELVEGITLKRFIEKKGSLDVSEAIGIGIQIAQGMQAAHDNHIIHRDIKPQNIIISKEGKVKVTDFGIAKAATSNTITSNAMGSVHYISPEQARGGYSDEKSDIYSLGVTLFEMLSGTVPYKGDSTVNVALSHIQDEIPVLEHIKPEILHSLSKIVYKCMQKKPDMRYMTASALIADLKRAIEEPDGDYIVIADLTDSSPTVVLGKDDVKKIKDPSNLKSTRNAYDEDEDAIDPKLEKILKICSGVVAVIIVFVIVLILGVFLGWWGGSGSKDDKIAATATPAATEKSDKKGGEGDNEMVEVPDIVGKSLEDAQKLLEEHDLKYVLKPVDSSKPANEVTKQEPEAGEEVEEGTEVKIFYSKEESGITIPDVKGKTKTQAQRTLEELGLVVDTMKEKYSDSVEKGKVCGTDPVTGSSVEEGSSVTIYVSKGPEGDMVKVPNIVNKTIEVAQEKLADAGLDYPDEPNYVYSDKVSKGRIVSQSLKSGTKVEQGTVVEFTVSLGSKNAATSTPKPTAAPSYRYTASLTVSDNPFDYEDESPATIKLVLKQDGKSEIVASEKLEYNDFPKTFSFEGWSESAGTVVVYKGGKKVGNYSVKFSKVKK